MSWFVNMEVSFENMFEYVWGSLFFWFVYILNMLVIDGCCVLNRCKEVNDWFKYFFI